MTALSGWGRYPISRAYHYQVQGPSEALRLLAGRQGMSVIARGAGRAYGDAAQNKDNLCLELTPANRFLGFDEKRGILHAEAGVTLEQIIETFVPRGWFLPVTPGTKYPTLGGSVACDVHGKSHCQLAHFVERVHLLLADGSVVACSPRERPDLFWATMGGMGLTGLIVSVELRLRPIESSYVNYEGVKARDLEHIFRLFEESGEQDMTVAWIDCLARGRNLGRSIMMRGRFARKKDLRLRAQRQNPLAVMRKPRITIPFDFPEITLNPLSMGLFNFAYYGKHPRQVKTIMDYDAFFYPLDAFLHWNRGYGRRGMVQYQYLIPSKHSFEGIKKVLEAISATGKASFLAVLKKFGNLQNKGMLSFPMPGYFIALDFPVGNGGILKHMEKWDELVLQYGGRLYLGKDSRMRPDTFAAMYPRLKEWQAIKAKVDPENVFSSDLARRLHLLPGAAAGRKRSKPRVKLRSK
ncbi:FAD-binding oxidoreductase [candidate division FCPU426 bacterium]|nr:FAD-binding oxidoreductase [candidate division FCPU426 bacterium]